MAVVHDLAEVRVGDITPEDGITKEQKHHIEMDAIHNMGVTERTRTLFAEYEAHETAEAQFVRFLDKLDMALQAERYERAGLDLPQFKEEAAKLAVQYGFSDLIPPSLSDKARGA